jgi:acetoin utilization protein AcuB
MSKTIPTIQKYMTSVPHSIGAEQSLSVADKLMRENRIRHLPVLEGGKILGVISDRDIKLTLGLKGSDADAIKAGEVCQPEPYVVSPADKLDDVVSTMAENKYGSALVVDNKKLVGIFTAVDAMRTLAELLSTRLK